MHACMPGCVNNQRITNPCARQGGRPLLTAHPRTKVCDGMMDDDMSSLFLADYIGASPAVLCLSHLPALEALSN